MCERCVSERCVCKRYVGDKQCGLCVQILPALVSYRPLHRPRSGASRLSCTRPASVTNTQGRNVDITQPTITNNYI